MPTTQHSPIVMRFRTLGGATVVVTKEQPDHDRTTADHAWFCEGCGAVPIGAPVRHEVTARSEANEHAGECRAMPR